MGAQALRRDTLVGLGDGYARLGIATSDAKRPMHYLRALIRSLPHVFQGLDVTQWYGGLIALKRLSRIYDDNMMLVGDAAGHVKPTSGGGIYTALLGARCCAGVAVRALSSDRLDASALADYQQIWMRLMGSELDRGWELRKAVLGLDDDEIDGLLGVLSGRILQALISHHGDIDFPSVLASALLTKQPSLGRFARAALRHAWRLNQRGPVGRRHSELAGS